LLVLRVEATFKQDHDQRLCNLRKEKNKYQLCFFQLLTLEISSPIS
jgi:hypothetical protein